MLEQAIAEADGILSGATAFELHDTYGFPIDLTVEIAGESGLEVDRVGFAELMDQQKNRAKQDAKDKKNGRWVLCRFIVKFALKERRYLPGMTR